MNLLIRRLSFLLLAFSALMLNSCDKTFRDELIEMHDQIDELRAKIDQTNSNLEALQAIVNALQNNDYVSGIIPISEGGVDIGYKITFTQSGTVTIYHGKEGKSPVMNVKEAADGVWYWTVDGQWLLDEDGNKVRAEGVAPQMKIEENRWLISYDDGESWTDLGKSTGEDGDSMFQDVRISDGEVVFVMYDGTEFACPRNARVRILLDTDGKETGILPGSEIKINYTLLNATDSTFVTASSNGHYTVRVEAFDKDHGCVYVKSPYNYMDGYINIMVSDGASYSFIKVVSFYEQKMLFPDGLEYNVSPQGGTIQIPFSTNFDYSFEVSSSARSWLSVEYAETKSDMRYGTLTVTVNVNEHEYARMGKVLVVPTNSAGDTYTEIIINQSSAYFSIDQSKFAVEVEGGTFVSNVRSSRGLSLKVDDSASWLQASVEQLGEDKYKVTTVISENESDLIRDAKVLLYSEDGKIHLGTLEFVQSSPYEEEISDMVFIVRANYSNDFTVYLPLAGEVDCMVNWGDGQAEHVVASSYYTEYAGVYHVYDVTEPSSFTVRISGTVTALSSSGISAPGVMEVVQWGKTGLVCLDSAFSGNSLLKKVAEAKYGAFSEVNDVNCMFKGCASLETIPENLFDDCTKLKYMSYTFSACSGLKAIPENIFSRLTNLIYISYIFENCTSLTEIPEGLFRYNVNLTDMAGLFSGCESLFAVPEDLFRYNTKVVSFSGLFSGCSSLEEIPENLFRYNTALSYAGSVFSSCTSLKKVPSGLFKFNVNLTSVYRLFESCYSLETIPVNIFDNNRKINDFSWAFYVCRSLSGESPYTVIDGVKYHLYERKNNPDQFVFPTSYSACFAFCSNLSDYDYILDSWK